MGIYEGVEGVGGGGGREADSSDSGAVKSPGPTLQGASATGHRLRIEFTQGDPFPTVRTVCPPGNVGCEPGRCEECPEDGLCAVCQRVARNHDACWIKTWDGEAECNVYGAVEVAVEVTPDIEGAPEFAIVGPPLPDRYPKVQGRCPSCHLTTLFLGSGGYVTCSLIGCPDPTSATALLAPTPAPTEEGS